MRQEPGFFNLIFNPLRVIRRFPETPRSRGEAGPGYPTSAAAEDYRAELRYEAGQELWPGVFNTLIGAVLASIPTGVTQVGGLILAAKGALHVGRALVESSIALVSSARTTIAQARGRR